MVIRRFYGLGSDEQALELSFVFRNQNGSKVGKTANNDDILVPVNGYTPPVVETVSYRWKSRSYVSHHLSNGVLNIETTHGLVQAIPYSGKIVEIKNFTGSLPEGVSLAPVTTPVIDALSTVKFPDTGGSGDSGGNSLAPLTDALAGVTGGVPSAGDS